MQSSSGCVVATENGIPFLSASEVILPSSAGVVGVGVGVAAEDAQEKPDAMEGALRAPLAIQWTIQREETGQHPPAAVGGSVIPHAQWDGLVDPAHGKAVQPHLRASESPHLSHLSFAKDHGEAI